ncbi:MAG TPA: hypothetical protein VGO61_13830 [Steroidobacteraceae bacterium]|jgi:hypothetical protein|nr:hypothetical protein [Steroidobacteraceae bacterium]
MHKQIAVALMLACAPPLASADVVELSPDLYLAIRLSRGSDAVAIKISAINEANQYAASSGRVATPVSGRLTMLGPMLKEYEYQFRLMSRAEALAAKPTLADVVVAVDGADACAVRVAPTVAALVPELGKLDVLRGRGLLAGIEPKKVEEAPASAPIPPAPDPVAQASAN